MKKALLWLTGVPLSLAAFGTAELYRYVFCRNQGKLLPHFLDKKNHAPDYYEHRAASEAAVRAHKASHCFIRSTRGEKLAGFYYCCGDKPCGKIAFIVHGYRSNHAETAGIHFDYYMSRGFDVFCCDHTAHGDSGGWLIGYDFYETEDCLRWLDYLRREYGEDVEIVLHGYSMGGATVLKMSERVPENVKFIVEDSGFESASGILKKSLGLMYSPLRLLNRLVGGYDLERDTQVYSALRRARVPILFVHGTADNMVPFPMAERLYAACGTDKDSLFTPEVVHIETMLRAPVAYGQKLDEFIRKYL